MLVLEKETFGGQITYSPRVENYPGIKQISGNEWASGLVEQILDLGCLDRTGNGHRNTADGLAGSWKPWRGSISVGR